MTKKILFTCVLFSLAFFMPSLAAELEPIPSGANIVVFVNNHGGLPLGELLKAAPLPPMARQKIDEFMNATAFNPLKDIARIQAMIKKGASKREDNAVVVLTGAFNKDKIMGFIKEKTGKEIAEEKSGDMSIFKTPDSKAGLCFIDNSRVAFGTMAALNVYLEARNGKEISTDYDQFKKMLNDKAYVVVMVGGQEFLKNQMQKGRERRLARLEKMNRMPNPVAKWFDTYVNEGVEPQGIFAQVLNDRVEAKIFYNRGESQGNNLQASIEINDPMLTIEKMFGEFLKVVGQLPAPEPKEKAPREEKSPEKW
ncbi:MAG TPA: hypothetical protein PLM07_01095 [Candidatus Rifleibacterium sp.]|nr:hypothetical protein [Candidatus Rifleibacterium sp.]HPT44477.1 hypothetical protein [Candidatus Rifleibacterium sp.]